MSTVYLERSLAIVSDPDVTIHSVDVYDGTIRFGMFSMSVADAHTLASAIEEAIAQEQEGEQKHGH